MIHFVVHDKADAVGVAVVENIKAGDELTGWVMDQDELIKFSVIDDIPIGHKLAIRDLKVGEALIKYNTDIGKVVSDVKKGEHLHVHNAKTKRW